MRTEKKRYLVLNQDKKLEVVFEGKGSEVIGFLEKMTGKKISKNTLDMRVKQNLLIENLLGEKYAIVEADFEDEESEEELWEKFDESKTHYYYVSNTGSIINVRKSTHKVKKHTVTLDKHGIATVRANRKWYQLKNLVAKFFLKGYKETKKPYIFLKDGNPLNCNVNNLVISTRKEEMSKETTGRNRIRCALYVKGKQVKTYNSLHEASADLYYDISDLSHYFKGNEHIKNLPFDLRRI